MSSRRLPALVIGGLLLGGLLLALFSFVVRFDQVVVVETFGRTGPETVYNDAESPEGQHDGLHFRWPSPVQKVYRYDRRVRLLDDRLGTQQTQDGQAVVVEAFVTWRIDRALAFHGHFKGDLDGADRFLRARLQTARGAIGRYRLDDLTAEGEAASALDELEAAMRADLRAGLAAEGDDPGYGIVVERVGIRRLLLPEAVTETVHERMRSTRLRLAEAARASGEGKRAQILAEAERTASKILEWARFHAERVRTEGESRALDHWEALEAYPELAVLRKKLEALRATTRTGTTLVLDGATAPFDLLDEARRDGKPDAPSGTDGAGRAGLDGSAPAGGSR